MWCKVSNATRMLSAINFLKTKALCVFEMIWGSTLRSLNKILEISVCMSLHRLIGSMIFQDGLS